MDPAEFAKMRAAFADMKKGAGVDPSTIEYLVIAVRFHKPADDLSFVAPDVMAVVGGDFSSDSLMTLGQLYLQDKIRVEKYGSKSIALMKVDPIAAQAEKNPILKPFVEIGAVPLSANSLAIGNLRYLKSAIDAADGNGRINRRVTAVVTARSECAHRCVRRAARFLCEEFWLMGLENTARESSCDTQFWRLLRCRYNDAEQTSVCAVQ